jgi:hypothetical protein
MSWGYRILLAYGLGVLFILFFVYKAMQIKTEMSEEHYYEKELMYNEFSNTKLNGNRVSNLVTVSVSKKKLQVLLSPLLSDSLANGVLYLYYPSAKIFDKTFTLSIFTSKNGYTIDRSYLHGGNCYARLSFDRGRKHYFIEKQIFIPFD